MLPLLYCACYLVDVAQNATEALAKFRDALETKKPYQLIITDLTLPGGMGGKELVQQLLALDPRIKAIVASGYSTDRVVANYKEYGFAGAISKPFLVETLRQKIAELLS